MSIYECMICGYIYDEAEGIPDSGIESGTLWGDLPEDWSCPLCGAPKSAFDKSTDGSMEVEVVVETVPVTVVERSESEALTPLEMSALCTNLARGFEKQYKPREEKLFRELGDYFQQAAPAAADPSFANLLGRIEEDLGAEFSNANTIASASKDRGALRALTWTEKVTRINQSILKRYEKKGDTLLEDKDVYVCSICGFIYLGNDLPEVCPICKVPNWKFTKVEGR